MRTRVIAVVSVCVVAMVLAGSWFSPAAADARRYRACVFVDRNRPSEAVIVDDLRVNETIMDERGVQYLWVHGPAGSVQLAFDLIRQIEVVKWMGKDPSRDDFTRYSVKVTGADEHMTYFGTMDVRVMRGLVGKAPWYYFPVTQRDRGLNLMRVTIGPECYNPTLPLEEAKPVETLEVVTAKPVQALPPPPSQELNADALGDIYFDYDKWGLRPASRDQLAQTAEWMRRWPNARLRIEGQADPRGTNEYNFPLGLHRANAARDYLIILGVPPERLETITMGKVNLVCTESTEECWQRNRRAHFVVISK